MHELNILLKIEFRRAFKNKLFAASIVIGLALAAGAFIQTVVPHIDVLGGYDGAWQVILIQYSLHGWESE